MVESLKCLIVCWIKVCICLSITNCIEFEDGHLDGVFIWFIKIVLLILERFYPSSQKIKMTSEQSSGDLQTEDERYQESVKITPDHKQCEQEVKFLKLMLAEVEEEKAAKMKTFNEETSNLESQVARLRALVERGETTRQNLEYELTLAKKATNQVRRIAVEKEADTKSNVAALKEQISELKSKLSNIEEDLANTKNQVKDDKEQFNRELQRKETEIKDLTLQLESCQNDSNKLHQIVQEQQNSMLELQEKCTSLEAQRQSQNNTLRHQAKDLEYGVEREERIKNELEQSRERVKNLEEHVEAERASHLETKFNSEIVQLRVRDLEGELEVKNSALNEAIEKVDMLTKQTSEYSEGLKKEHGKCDELSSNLKHLHEKYSSEKKRTRGDVEEKQKLIEGLSEQLEIHQQNFDALKKELNQAKKHQNDFDKDYSGCVKDLEKLVETFGKLTSAKSKSKTGRSSKDHLASSPSSALIDDIREILLDHQTTRTNAVNEAKKLKIMSDNLSRENTGYQQLMWSRDQAVEDVKQAANTIKHELSQTQIELANKGTTCASLKVELQTLKQQLGEELRNCEKNEEELAQIKNQQVNDDRTRLSFLHTIYQCLVAGQFYTTPPSDSYENFTWNDMTRLMSDQIGSHISELNRAKEKVVYLEELSNSKEQHIKQTQEDHEDTIKKLATTLKEREQSWKTQSRDLEEHYGKLITDLHLRVQKTQEMADEAFQKAQQTSTINKELEVQNKSLKNSRKKYIKEKTALLASCALLAGTLWPACVQNEILKSQKKTLISINSRLDSLQKHTSFLCETLNNELSVTPSSMRRSQPGGTLLLKFRAGVVAILALNRLVNFAARQKTCIVLSQGAVEGLETARVVHCGRSTQQSVEFRGIATGQKLLGDASLHQVSPSWFSNEQLLSHAVSSMNDLCEKISSRNEKDPSCSWSPDSCVTITRTAKHCYEKLLNKLRAEFHNDDADTVVSSLRLQSRPRNDLILALGNGLHRCLKKLPDSSRHRYATTHDLINSLQNFVLGLTQRLHNVEVERRDLRLEVNALQKEKDELRKAVEKRQHESQEVYKDIEGMREKLTSSVPRSQFENLYSELSSALEREKQAQKILNKQASQLKDMEYKLNTVNRNSEQTEATLAEAIKNLSEVKMEVRRKQQIVRQVTKDTQLVESEKRLLQEKINDAEKTITGAARERETILLYLKGIQKALKQSEDSLKQSSKRRSLQELSNFLLNEGRLTNEGYPLGPAILACQSVVNGFLEMHQQTLVLLSQLEAEKQQAQVKFGSLETEINSHRSHINSLKDELASVCQRQLNDEEIYHYGRSHVEENTDKHYSVRKAPDFGDQKESESYSREFVPLMRYDSISPVKSPQKHDNNAPYSSSHRHPHDTRPEYRDNGNGRTSRR